MNITWTRFVRLIEVHQLPPFCAGWSTSANHFHSPANGRWVLRIERNAFNSIAVWQFGAVWQSGPATGQPLVSHWPVSKRLRWIRRSRIAVTLVPLVPLKFITQFITEFKRINSVTELLETEKNSAIKPPPIPERDKLFLDTNQRFIAWFSCWLSALDTAQFASSFVFFITGQFFDTNADRQRDSRWKVALVLLGSFTRKFLVSSLVWVPL